MRSCNCSRLSEINASAPTSGRLRRANRRVVEGAAATAYGRELCDRISDVGVDPLVGVVHHENVSAGVTMHQSALIIGAAISKLLHRQIRQLAENLDY
jgi:hypothetical protein